MVQITLDSTHAYPLAVAVFSGFVVQYLGAKVSGARKRANVPYPYMYATREEAEKEPTKHLFNCAQRAHQNTLENYPQFLMLLAIASIEHPTFAAGSGLVYLVGRIVYGIGYRTGNPASRNRGAFGYLGLFGVLGASIKTIYNLLQ